MLKLYVLIRSDLTEAQQAVQAGHALAQFGLEHPKEFKHWQEDNNILIYLSVNDIHHWETVLDDGDFKYSMFHESNPFVAYDTAIAVAPNFTCQYVLFKDLPLAFRPQGRKRWWRR